MRFSIPSFLGLSCLSLLASTGLAATIPRSHDDTEIIVDIYQLFNNYSRILDDKSYADLSYILTEDAAFYLPTFNYTSRATAESRYESEFLNKTTLHTVENIFVYDITSTSASVVGDGITTYFGTGNLTGQSVVDWNRITYTVTKESGSWLISSSTVGAGVSSY